jgi:hypothetical protein
MIHQRLSLLLDRLEVDGAVAVKGRKWRGD